MSIYVIGDLHLSFSADKPMDIFGYNWEKHADKIRESWIQNVTEYDTVILPGDFSWATYLPDTYKDFEFLNSLPGRKILSKGNHDYWWTTLTSMRKYLKECGFENIDFLYNNAYLVEDKIITGTRGWINTWKSQDNYKILKRENDRLKLSIQDGIKNFGEDKEIITFIHHPPFYKEVEIPDEINFIKTMKDYNIKTCYYAHLHGESHKEAIEGNVNGIEYKLVSSDYLKFNLLKIN